MAGLAVYNKALYNEALYNEGLVSVPAVVVPDLVRLRVSLGAGFQTFEAMLARAIQRGNQKQVE